MGVAYAQLVVSKKELTEIYNALCWLNISIRQRQPKRAKFVQNLIERVAFAKEINSAQAMKLRG